jgi:FkbM family methyltransferase
LTSDAFDPFALIRSILGPRAFALADTPPDAELCALLNLGETAAAHPDLAVALSAITTPRVRALFQGQTTFRTTSGLSFTVDGRDIFAATLAAGYLPEGRDFEAIMQLVRPGSVVVDVGANFGLYALSAALYARPQGKVFAFEPAPNAFALLQRNIAENGLSGIVTAKTAAVAAAPGRAQFLVGQDVSFSSLHRTKRLEHHAGAVEVDVVTLDMALSQTPSIDVLKIDVEGGEGDVLRGARELLRRSRAPVIQFEFSHKNMDEARRAAFDETIALLTSDGFRIYRRGAAGPAALPAASETFSGNLFLAREGEPAERLLHALGPARKGPPDARDLSVLALLRRITQQNEALERADLLQREAIEVADSIVGDRPDDSSTAVRAMQQAWFEARKRALEAENQVATLSASVEGRDRFVEQSAEKIASLRASINQLRSALEQSRAAVVAVQERNSAKLAAWRERDAKLRARIEALEGALLATQEKLDAKRMGHDQLRAQLEASETKRQHMINVTKRVRARYEALAAGLGGDAGAEPTAKDETASS